MNCSNSGSILRSSELVIPNLQNHFARLTVLDHLNSLGNPLQGKPVRYDRKWVDLPCSKEANHLMPGLVHLSACDPIQGETLEYDIPGEVHLGGPAGGAEHVHPAA